MPTGIAQAARAAQRATRVEMAHRRGCWRRCPVRQLLRPQAARMSAGNAHLVCLADRAACVRVEAGRLGFLDFTTLAAPRLEEELRLEPAARTRALPRCGAHHRQRPVLGGDGPALEYAVKMREFPQDARSASQIPGAPRAFTRRHRRGGEGSRLSPRKRCAAPRDGMLGSPDDSARRVAADFTQIRPHLTTAEERDELEEAPRLDRARTRGARQLLRPRKDSDSENATATSVSTTSRASTAS